MTGTARALDLAAITDDDLAQVLINEGAFTAAERAAFLLQRFVLYKHHLIHGDDSKPASETERLRYARLRDLADRVAFEDLQALLGRRGELAAKVEWALLDQERAEE